MSRKWTRKHKNTCPLLSCERLLLSTWAKLLWRGRSLRDMSPNLLYHFTEIYRTYSIKNKQRLWYSRRKSVSQKRNSWGFQNKMGNVLSGGASKWRWKNSEEDRQNIVEDLLKTELEMFFSCAYWYKLLFEYLWRLCRSRTAALKSFKRVHLVQMVPAWAQ